MIGIRIIASMQITAKNTVMNTAASLSNVHIHSNDKLNIVVSLLFFFLLNVSTSPAYDLCLGNVNVPTTTF